VGAQNPDAQEVQPCAQVTHPWSHCHAYPVKLTNLQVSAVSAVRLRAACCPWAYSELGEARQAAARLVPPVCHPDDPAGRLRALEQGQQLAAAGHRALGYHPHTAVLKVLRPSGEAELERPRARPPTEANALNPAFNPRGEPGKAVPRHGRAFGRGWHLGQLNADLFMNGSRRTGVPHLGHGWPALPYTASDRSK